MLSDHDIEEAAEVCADALARFPDLKTNLGRGYIIVGALEEAGYSLHRNNPPDTWPPEGSFAESLENVLRASLADQFAAEQFGNIVEGNFRRGGAA